jgi:hypothetical protein
MVWRYVSTRSCGEKNTMKCEEARAILNSGFSKWQCPPNQFYAPLGSFADDHVRGCQHCRGFLIQWVQDREGYSPLGRARARRIVRAIQAEAAVEEFAMEEVVVTSITNSLVFRALLAGADPLRLEMRRNNLPSFRQDGDIETHGQSALITDPARDEARGPMLEVLSTAGENDLIVTVVTAKGEQVIQIVSDYIGLMILAEVKARADLWMFRPDLEQDGSTKVMWQTGRYDVLVSTHVGAHGEVTELRFRPIPVTRPA